MADFTERPRYIIIREVYEQGGVEDFENELDQALEFETETVVIEPVKLGIETARWIAVGNFLHKTAVVCGLGCITTSLASCKEFIVLPFGFTSFICAGVYSLSWQFDPCCKYQVETDMRKIDNLPLHKLATTSPVILVRKDDKRRKVLHNTVAVTATLICFWRLYKLYSS